MRLFIALLWIVVKMASPEARDVHSSNLFIVDNSRAYSSISSGSAISHNRLEEEQLIEVNLRHTGQVRNRKTLFSTSLDGERPRRAVTSLVDRLWPNGIIPYIIGDNITNAVRENIFLAMEEWEKHTCVVFVNRTTEEHYLLFNPGACGCCSFVGRRGGSQDVSLSAHCAVYGVVLHELGHVIGFWHEHSRPDRDNYINVMEENIIPEKLENFAKKAKTEIDSLGQPYDYNSVMHYRKNTFSKNHRESILPRAKDVYIGQRDVLSPGDILQANLLYDCPKPVCFEEFTVSEGYFKTPNYPMNYFKDHNCTWIIHVNQGEEVLLEFTDFDLERSDGCRFDHIDVREGTNERGFLIGRLCGKGVPGIIQSTSSLWIRFVSDSSFIQRGFSARYRISDQLNGSGKEEIDNLELSSGSGYMPVATYTAECNEYLQRPQGYILTPLVPIRYSGEPLECAWTIDGGPEASSIVLSIEIPGLTVQSAQCAGMIYQRIHHRLRHKSLRDMEPDGNRSKTKWSIRLKGERYSHVHYDCFESQRLLLNTSTVMVQWSSHFHPEFSATYTIDYDECALGTDKCEHYCTNTLGGYACSCKPGYTLHPGGYKCVPKAIEVLDRCGGNLTSLRGKLRAATEPFEDCYFYIYQLHHSRLQLTFTKFNIPSDKDKDDSCLDNFVEIYTGKVMNSKGRYCGRSKPPILTSSHDRVVIRTHTNLRKAIMLPYFSAKYIIMEDQSNDDKCFYKTKAHGTVIKSPGFPKAYSSDVFCVWRVSARKGERVRMIFDFMDIEKTRLCSFDYLEVYDGKHMSSNVIGRYCGTSVPEPIISTGKHLRIIFVTDKSGTGKGYKIHFDTVPAHQ